MRYWKFDPINLIRDFNRNKNAIASIQLQIKMTKDEIKNPFVETDVGQCERRLKQLELLLEQYRMYVDWVTLGFNVLEELERKVLELRYIDGLDVADTGKTLFMPNSKVEKIEKQAILSFSRVVSPI